MTSCTVFFLSVEFAINMFVSRCIEIRCTLSCMACYGVNRSKKAECLIDHSSGQVSDMAVDGGPCQRVKSRHAEALDLH